MPDGLSFGVLGRWLIIIGITLVGLGILLVLFDRFGLLGGLRGDIIVRRKNWTLWIPIASSLILSVLASFILYLLRRR